MPISHHTQPLTPCHPHPHIHHTTSTSTPHPHPHPHHTSHDLYLEAMANHHDSGSARCAYLQNTLRVPDGASSSVRLRFGPGFLLVLPGGRPHCFSCRGVSSVLVRAYACRRTSSSSPPSSVEKKFLLLHHQGPRPRSQQPRPPLRQWLDRLSGGGRGSI